MNFKDFWIERSMEIEHILEPTTRRLFSDLDADLRVCMGDFFWNRGGKRFIERMLEGNYTIDEIIVYFNSDGNTIFSGRNSSFTAENYKVEEQNAFDAFNCLGVEKFKVYIQGVE